MRKNRAVSQKTEFSILTLDDDNIMTVTLQSYFQALGFSVDTENNPFQAIEKIRTGNYDILLLDFLMIPINGDEVVRRVREFNKDIFIILLTGHKSMAPPLKTIRELDIQGYYEKSDRFDQLEMLVESCSKSIRQMRVIRRYRDGLNSILEHMPDLSVKKSLEEMSRCVLGQISELFDWKNSMIYLNLDVLDEQMGEIGTVKSDFCLGTGMMAGANKLGRQLFDVCHSSGGFCQKDVEGVSYSAVPLTAENGDVFGLLAAPQSEFTEDSRHLFEVYARQVSFVVSGYVFRIRLEIQNRELNRSYMETVDAMRKMVDARDVYTRGHSDRVSYYGTLIAKAMNKDEEYIHTIRVGGLFHDVGKVGIPDSILRKAAGLDDQEYDQIKQHPIIGKKMLASVTYLKKILSMVESHHERYDGKGYPYGLSGEELTEEARIISVADAFDAMTSKRTYRDGMTVEHAVSELVRGKGTQFDPNIVDVFLQVLEENPDILDQVKETFSEINISDKQEAWI